MPLLISESDWRAQEHTLRGLLESGAKPARVDVEPATDDGETMPSRHDRIMEMPALDTAVVYIDGLILKHVDLYDLEWLGATDLDDVDAALDEIAADDRIRNLLLVFNSPGGQIIGVPETAAKIAALARIKNVKSFSDSQCCSAAYYIASQAAELFVTASTYTGSVGVTRPPIIDISKQLAMNGVTPTIIKSGKFKDTGTMLRPITDEEIAMLQAQSDQIMAMFTAAVRSGRPRIQDDAMQGQVYFGSKAVGAGFADSLVADLKQALAQF